MNRLLLGINLVLVAALCALWGLDHSLETRRDARRATDSAFHAIDDAATPAVSAIARIELLLPGSTTRWSLEKKSEGWRLPQYRDAFALGQEIDGLLKAILESRGTIVGRLPQDAMHFGFVPGKVIEAGLYGSSSMPLLKATAGAVAPGQRSGECFLAAEGLDQILHANANPWPYVQWDSTSRFPPLTDPKVMPTALGRGYAAKITFGGEAAPPVRELIRREIPKERLNPMMDKGPRYEWFGTFADGEKRVNDNVAGSYLGGLTGLLFDDLLGDLKGREGVFAKPVLTITLENDGGTKDTLTLGLRDPNGLSHFLNGSSGQVFLISAAKVASLTPDTKALLELPRAPPQAPPQVPPQAFPQPGAQPVAK